MITPHKVARNSYCAMEQNKGNKMQVSVEEKEGLERVLTITIEALIFDEQFDARVRKLCKTERVNGFRTGKIPVSVIEKRFGPKIEHDVSNELVEIYFYKAVMAEDIKPAGKPLVDFSPRKKGEPFVFTAKLEVFPAITVSAVNELNLEKVTAEVTDEDLDNMINTLRQQQATWATAQRKAQNTDRVTIDFVGRVDGEIFEGGRANAFKLELGSKRMIPGFESGILGHEAGNEFTIELTFPDDYQAEALKGKDAKFEITLTQVEEPILPEINDEFVKKFGIESGGEEALRLKVKENMQRELSQMLKNDMNNVVINSLIENNELLVPKALVANEISALRQQTAASYSKEIEKIDMLDLPDNLFAEEAEKHVKRDLLLTAIIKSHDLKVDNDKVAELIKLSAASYDNPAEIIEYYSNNKDMMKHIEDIALKEQAIEFIIESAKIIDINKSFDEVMRKKVP